MRRAAKVDANQQEIVKAIRACGASVQPLHTVGRGCPDLLVGYHGKNLVWELKDGNLPPSKQALTTDELDWHREWTGSVVIVRSIEEALACLARSFADCGR
jgi:hypothetical protein